MSSKFSYVWKVYEAKTATPNSDVVPNPRCTIDLHIRFRYQLKIPTNEATVVVIEDLVIPEQRTSLQVPIIFPLATWRELYLSNILKSANLDNTTCSYLNPKVSEAIASIAERKGNKGFDIVVKVGILKAEMMSKEEVNRIAARVLAKIKKGSSESLHFKSHTPDVIIIDDDDDEPEACMSNIKDLKQAKMEGCSGDYFHSPAQDVIIIDEDDESEACMSNIEDLESVC